MQVKVGSLSKGFLYQIPLFVFVTVVLILILLTAPAITKAQAPNDDLPPFGLLPPIPTNLNIPNFIPPPPDIAIPADLASPSDVIIPAEAPPSDVAIPVEASPSDIAILADPVLPPDVSGPELIPPEDMAIPIDLPSPVDVVTYTPPESSSVTPTLNRAISVVSDPNTDETRRRHLATLLDIIAKIIRIIETILNYERAELGLSPRPAIELPPIPKYEPAPTPAPVGTEVLVIKPTEVLIEPSPISNVVGQPLLLSPLPIEASPLSLAPIEASPLSPAPIEAPLLSPLAGDLPSIPLPGEVPFPSLQGSNDVPLTPISIEVQS